jgi:hypothetical protein
MVLGFYFCEQHFVAYRLVFWSLDDLMATNSGSNCVCVCVCVCFISIIIIIVRFEILLLENGCESENAIISVPARVRNFNESIFCYRAGFLISCMAV